MRAGDLVRFKYTGAFAEEWKIGLVREYDSLYKVVVVIFEGKGRMPAWKNLLNVEQGLFVIDYIRLAFGEK